MKKTFAALVILTLMTWSFDAMASTPEPSFQTIQKDDPFEVRLYVPQLAADVQLTGPEATMSAAFRILANYIFKEYPTGAIGMTAPVTVQDTQKIGMTAPVTVDAREQSVFMRFYLPERYTLKTLPQPEDARIQIVSVPARRVAVIRFSGWLGAAKIAKNEALLRDWMAKHDLKAIGPAETQGYDAPWVLPWWRRNEIWVPVAQ
jgi:hypothetical protein